MASSVTPSLHTSHFKSVFLGENNGFRVRVPVTHTSFSRKNIECKESRIGKQPIPVPSNVAITMQGQDMKVKGPLGELAITYPREVIVEKEESGALRVRKAVETRRANQMHGLFSHFKSVFLGENNGFRVRVPVTHTSFSRKNIECKESRIGKQPIPVPSNVAITMQGQDMKVKGPLGELAITYPREVIVEKEESGALRVRKAVETRRANQMHGLFRTLTDNMVTGVSKGFEKRLQLVGVGYRAMVEGKDLVLSLGFSHPVKMTIPDDLKVKVEENTRVTVSGFDKCNVGQFAASIRSWRPPEPYKGKGIRYADEVVRRKEGKAGKKK